MNDSLKNDSKKVLLRQYGPKWAFRKKQLNDRNSQKKSMIQQNVSGFGKIQTFSPRP